MKLTTRSEYGLLALIFLARQDPEGCFSVEAIAQAQQIPAKFLEQILLSLKRAGYVRSVRGSRGGYRLAKPAAQITIAEVVRLLDGALAPSYSVSRYFYEPTPIEREQSLTRFFQEIATQISSVMEKTSIADVT
jgi:Rrf2 family protein